MHMHMPRHRGRRRRRMVWTTLLSPAPRARVHGVVRARQDRFFDQMMRQQTTEQCVGSFLSPFLSCALCNHVRLSSEATFRHGQLFAGTCRTFPRQKFIGTALTPVAGPIFHGLTVPFGSSGEVQLDRPLVLDPLDPRRSGDPLLPVPLDPLVPT